MSSVTHFEIYASDPSNLASFYYVLFGWRLAKAPGIDYWWIQTEPGHTNEFNGRLMHRPIPEPRRWAHYVNVDSLDEAIARVQQLGGSVLRLKTPVPKTGWYAVLADPEGNIFAVWQADPTAFPPPEPEEERSDEKGDGRCEAKQHTRDRLVTQPKKPKGDSGRNYTDDSLYPENNWHG